MNKLLILAAVLMTSSSCISQAQERVVAIHGAGDDSCGEYVQSYESYRQAKETDHVTDASIIYLQEQAWIEGFLDSIPANTSAQYRYDVPAMQVWIYNYCRKHPLDPLLSAAGGMAYELRHNGKSN